MTYESPTNSETGKWENITHPALGPSPALKVLKVLMSACTNSPPTVKRERRRGGSWAHLRPKTVKNVDSSQHGQELANSETGRGRLSGAGPQARRRPLSHKTVFNVRKEAPESLINPGITPPTHPGRHIHPRYTLWHTRVITSRTPCGIPGF